MMRSANSFQIFLLLTVAISASTGRADEISCPTPFRQRNTRQAGKCSQVVYLLLAQGFGKQRVFVPTCSHGYRRLGSDLATN